MLWIYGHYKPKYFCFFSAGIDSRHQNLTSTDIRFRRLILPLPISHLCENYLYLLNSHVCEILTCTCITCVVENCHQPDWSVTWTQCYLATITCIMSGSGAVSGVLLKIKSVSGGKGIRVKIDPRAVTINH